MKESLREKLVGLVERYEEVGRLLSDQKTIADKERFRELSKEYARLAEVAQDFEEYRKLEADIAASAELRASDDSELRSLAEDEHRDLVARRDARLAALLNHLVPRDPDDDANLFLEAKTTATFSAPGEYVVRAQVNDASGDGGKGEQCCWTTAHVKVIVK